MIAGPRVAMLPPEPLVEAGVVAAGAAAGAAALPSEEDDEAGDDARAQIDEDHQHECHQQHDGIAPRGADQRRKFLLLGHIPGHHRQHARERRERNVGSERGRHEHEQQQEDRMQHARDRPARA